MTVVDTTVLKRCNGYGLTVEDWNLLFESQGRACGICRLPEDEVMKPLGRTPWHVDHCHATGVVRGILCSHCNQGVGHFRDDPALLTAARTYLEHSLALQLREAA